LQVNLISHTPDPFLAIATAAVITRGDLYCQAVKMPRKKLEDIVRDCYECGHWSVFEFAEWDFQVSEVSRVLETQAIRSRLASFEWETGRRENAYVPSDAIDDKNYMTHLIEEITDITSDLAPEDARYSYLKVWLGKVVSREIKEILWRHLWSGCVLMLNRSIETL
jgi:hypothetical protein